MTEYEEYEEYEKLVKKAIRYDSTKEDRLNLLKWFENNNYCDWSGECFQINKDYKLYPIYQGDGEPDEDGEYISYTVIDAEIR